MNSAGVLAEARLSFDRAEFQVVLFALGILDDVEAKLEAFDQVQIRRDDIGMMKENSLAEVIAGRALGSQEEGAGKKRVWGWKNGLLTSYTRRESLVDLHFFFKNLVYKYIRLRLAHILRT